MTAGTAPPPPEASRREPDEQQATPPAAARFRPDIVWAGLTLPLASLAAAGLSVALFVQMLVMTARQREDFLIGNALLSTARDEMVWTVLGGAGVPLLVAALALLLGRGRAVPLVERAARVLAALIPACLLPALFNVRFSHQNQLTYLLVLGGFVLMFEPLLRHSLQALPTIEFWGRLQEEARSLRRLPLPPSRVFFFALVCLASAGYATYFGYYTILNHHRTGTTASISGSTTTLWAYNALHGRPFVSPVRSDQRRGTTSAGHAEFAMFLFVPFFAIHPGPETMLIFQAVGLRVRRRPCTCSLRRRCRGRWPSRSPSLI